MKVDEIVVFVCILIGTWYFGFLYGQHSTRCVAPEMKQRSVHDMTKAQQRRWVRYYTGREM